MDEKLQQISDYLFDKTGKRLDIDKSTENLDVAFACEAQRNNSKMPEIPVISAIEISDKDVLNGKLDNFGSDYFFFLKEQEAEFDANPYPSSFYAEDRAEIDNIIKEDLLSEVTSQVLTKWLEYAQKGDKIRIRKSMPGTVTGKVARLVDGEAVIEETKEYVLVLVATEEFFEFSNAFPV